MEKWASKWLEMRYQIHRFKKKSGGGPPDPPSNKRMVHTPPPHTLPLTVFAARFKPSASLGPALTNND